MYTKILFVLIILLIVYLIISFFKKIMLYYPQKASDDKYQMFFYKLITMTGSEENIQNKFIETPDGVFLDTIYIKKPDTDKCIILFHGNTGNISNLYNIVNFLYNYASVVVFDYRSYGRSSGLKINLTSEGLFTDARTVWSYVINDLDYYPNDVSLYGISLGCSVAIYLTVQLSKTLDQNNYPDALILNSPFFSLKAMIKIMFNQMKMNYLGSVIAAIYGNEYQSNEWISYLNHKTKIVMTHSVEDKVIPYQEGFKLYKLIAKTHAISFYSVTGYHGDVGIVDDYIYKLAEIFQKN